MTWLFGVACIEQPARRYLVDPTQEWYRIFVAENPVGGPASPVARSVSLASGWEAV